MPRLLSVGGAQAPQQVLPCAAGGCQICQYSVEVLWVCTLDGVLLVGSCLGSASSVLQPPPRQAEEMVQGCQNGQRCLLFRQLEQSRLPSLQKCLGAGAATTCPAVSIATMRVACNAACCFRGSAVASPTCLERAQAILSLLFSHSWQWVERMADLDMWLLCCWYLANGMQQQAG